MKLKNARESILEYLANNQWVAGGTLEIGIAMKTGHKPSYVGRELRQMAEDNLLDKKYEQIDGKGIKFVNYKIRLKDKLF